MHTSTTQEKDTNNHKAEVDTLARHFNRNSNTPALSYNYPTQPVMLQQLNARNQHQNGGKCDVMKIITPYSCGEESAAQKHTTCHWAQTAEGRFGFDFRQWKTGLGVYSGHRPTNTGQMKTRQSAAVWLSVWRTAWMSRCPIAMTSECTVCNIE